MAIVKELRYDAVITLTGTQKRQWNDEPADSARLDKHWGFAWGWRASQRDSNKAAGVTLLFKQRWFNEAEVRQVHHPPMSMAGRAGAVTLEGPRGHFCFAAVYWPPRPNGAAARAKWAKTIGALTKWMDDLWAKLPARVLPVLLGDLNDRLGRPRSGAAACEGLVGSVGAEDEGEASSRLREWLQRHRMCVPSTFAPLGPTFFGTTSSSRIDYVVCPGRAMAQAVCELPRWAAASVHCGQQAEGSLAADAGLADGGGSSCAAGLQQGRAVVGPRED